jgi:hypothetical protein
MWRQTVLVHALVIGICSQTGIGNAQILLDFDDADVGLIKGAVEGAAARLAHSSCQNVLSDFVDQNGVLLSAKLAATGRNPVEAFMALRIVNSPLARQCRTGKQLAFTIPGSQVIHICSLNLKTSIRRSDRTQFVMIHEFLHSLGLGENPPTSQAITNRVATRCGG